jgi:hypothetical protein
MTLTVLTQIHTRGIIPQDLILDRYVDMSPMLVRLPDAVLPITAREYFVTLWNYRLTR